MKSPNILYIYDEAKMPGMEEQNINPLKLLAEIGHREALLGAVAYSAKALLSTGDWVSQMDKILEKLGEASDSSRVYVFQHEIRSDNKLLTTIMFEWCAPGVSPQIKNPELHKMEIGAVGFSRWIELMDNGETVYGIVETFPDDERVFLESQEIKSVVVIPFSVSGKWWGFIGFDQCDRVRDWSLPEVEALQAAANMIGSAIERKAAEDKMEEQFEELQKTNHELDFFVYSVSHDLRAPLASILGLVNIAEMDNASQREREYLGMIRKSVTKLDNFIKEVLDYSRNSRIGLHIERIDLKSLLDDLYRRLIPLDMDQQFVLDLEVNGDVDFYSDKKRLDVIFNNLLGNSIKFRDTEKTSTKILIRIHIHDNESEVHFEDNGIGIEPHHLDKLFNMFYRATDRATGSGLGLYITKEVLNKLGGKIEVNSTFGRGTAFSLRIPNLQG